MTLCTTLFECRHPILQEYLFENGRIDNIFTDMYYEPFTSALHEVVKDFKLPMNEMGYYVTRIEEEHLWEAKQLGAHSPQVKLLSISQFNNKTLLISNGNNPDGVVLIWVYLLIAMEYNRHCLDIWW